MRRTATMIFFFAIFISTSYPSATKGLEVIDNGVSLVERKTLVGKHNDCRSKVARGDVLKQPEACRNHINKLVWDEQIAKEAQKVADTCVFAHVSIKDDRWSIVGQNLGLEWSSNKEKGANWTFIIDKWFIENENYVYPETAAQNTGHYTQLVWNTTLYVGCGYTHFVDKKATGVFFKLYICHYGPGGNIRGYAPYKYSEKGCEEVK